jgi:FkbM family methyltransferase
MGDEPARPTDRMGRGGGAGPAEAGWRSTAGLLRSLLIYHAVPFKIRRLAELYRLFVERGELCFDLGAHVGDRTRALLRLGARVVAVEPQPLCADFLERWYRKDRRVTLVRAALGAVEGQGVLRLSARTPTVSSLSPDWIDRVRRAPRFATVTWDRQVTVVVTTLDRLIERFGVPAFCKVDVEGSEPDVLRGLSRPIRALSFEYIPAIREATQACLGRLEALGDYEYNWTEREVPRLRSANWLDAHSMWAIMAALPDGAHSGDIYARLKNSGRWSVVRRKPP